MGSSSAPRSACRHSPSSISWVFSRASFCWEVPEKSHQRGFQVFILFLRSHLTLVPLDVKEQQPADFLQAPPRLPSSLPYLQQRPQTSFESIILFLYSHPSSLPQVRVSLILQMNQKLEARFSQQVLGKISITADATLICLSISCYIGPSLMTSKYINSSTQGRFSCSIIQPFCYL